MYPAFQINNLSTYQDYLDLGAPYSLPYEHVKNCYVVITQKSWSWMREDKFNKNWEIVRPSGLFSTYMQVERKERS